MPVGGGRRPALGRRILRPGMTGRDVALLQRRLTELGYDPGRDDGVFGILTKEAVREFERDCHLRVDGIAGPQVVFALSSAAPMRVTHRFAPGDSVAGIARRYGVTTGLVLRTNRVEPNLIPEGHPLVIPARTVIGVCSPGPIAGQWLARLDRILPQLSAVAARRYELCSEGLRQTHESDPRLPRVEALCRLFGVSLLGVVQLPCPCPVPAARLESAVRQAVDVCLQEKLSGVCLWVEEPAATKPKAVMRAVIVLGTMLRQRRLRLITDVHPPVRIAASHLVDFFVVGIQGYDPVIPRWKLAASLVAGPTLRTALRIVMRDRLGGVVISGLGNEGESTWEAVSDTFCVRPLGLRADVRDNAAS